VVLLSDEEPETDETLKVLNLATLMAAGSNQPLQPVNQNRDTLATLIYTLKPGKPKGVMLSHGNLLHQITTFGAVFGAVQPQPGDRFPVSSQLGYERTCEYLSQVVRKFIPISATSGTCRNSNPRLLAFPGCGNQL